ncbi:MAG: hypothetical protein L6R41_003346 [Letrouitia leprolyta]|nr:MAG: hypothetical protein L6R41_003346 [Letrouitia leprolyta]
MASQWHTASTLDQTPPSATSSNNTYLMPMSPSKKAKGAGDSYRPKVVRTLGQRPACLVNASVTYCGNDQIYAFGGFDQYTDEGKSPGYVPFSSYNLAIAKAIRHASGRVQSFSFSEERTNIGSISQTWSFLTLVLPTGHNPKFEDQFQKAERGTPPPYTMTSCTSLGVWLVMKPTHWTRYATWILRAGHGRALGASSLDLTIPPGSGVDESGYLEA